MLRTPSDYSPRLMLYSSNSCKNCLAVHLLEMAKLLNVLKLDQVATTRAMATLMETVIVISNLGSAGLLVQQLRGPVVGTTVDAAMITLPAMEVLHLPGLPALVVAVIAMGMDSSLVAMALPRLVRLVELLPGNNKLRHRLQVALQATTGMGDIPALATAIPVLDTLLSRTWVLLQVLVVVWVVLALLLGWVPSSRTTLPVLLEARHRLLHLLATLPLLQ